MELLVNNVCQKGNVGIDDSPIDPLLMFQCLYCIVWYNKVLVVMNTADRHTHSLADTN